MNKSDENKDEESFEGKKKMGFLSRNTKRAMYSPTAERHRATEDAVLGNFEEAIEGYDEYLELWPKDAEVIAIKAYVTSVMGENEEALDIYDESLKIDPKRAWTWFEKGALLEEMERYSEAVLCYHKSLECTKEGFRNYMKNRPDPPKEEILGPISHAYFHAGSKDDLRLAEKYMNKALEIEPEQHEALQTKVHLLIEGKKWQEVLDVCEMALNNDDENEFFIAYQADAHIELKDPTEAYDSITRLLAIDSSDKDYWFLLARYYALIGKNEEAIDKLIVGIHLGLELKEETINDSLFNEIRTMPGYERLLKLQDDIFMP